MGIEKPTESQFFELMAADVAIGMRVKDAAERAGCSADYGWKLARGDAFRRRVAELRTEITTQAVGRMSELTAEAVEVVAEGLLDIDRDAQWIATYSKVRLPAAKQLLASLIQLAQFSDLQQRIDDLERRATEEDRASGDNQAEPAFH